MSEPEIQGQRTPTNLVRTTLPLPGGPIATIREALDSIPREHLVEPESATVERHTMVRTYKHAAAVAALDLLSELVRAAQEHRFVLTNGKGARELLRDRCACGRSYCPIARALLPFETSTEEGK